MSNQEILATDIDWDALKTRAIEMTKMSYVPYSNYPVGAAAFTTDGRIVSGCNVENAGYGVTLCAECGLISELIATGGGKLKAFLCVNGAGDIIMPCGRCRQLLFEHGGRALLVNTVSGIKTMDQVLPDAFGPEALDEYKESEAK